MSDSDAFLFFLYFPLLCREGEPQAKIERQRARHELLPSNCHLRRHAVSFSDARFRDPQSQLARTLLLPPSSAMASSRLKRKLEDVEVSSNLNESFCQVPAQLSFSALHLETHS